MSALKRRVLSLESKLSIINKIGSGVKKSSICKELNLSHSTLSCIWGNRDKIIAAYQHNKHAKKVRKPVHADIDSALLNWILENKNENININGPYLKNKAEEFGRALGVENFTCSNGWLDRFKIRHNISYGILSEQTLLNPVQLDFTDLGEYTSVPRHGSSCFNILPHAIMQPRSSICFQRLDLPEAAEVKVHFRSNNCGSDLIVLPNSATTDVLLYTMDDLCFICEKSLSEGDFVNVVRGLKTLKTASIERNDGHIDFLNTLTSVNVHIVCRKVYSSKNSIAASKRRLEEGEPLPPISVPLIKMNEVFDFKKLCLFCGQTADRVAESRKQEKYRRAISKVSTLGFKDNVIKRAEERKDFLGIFVKARVLYEYDLIAAEAKYHTVCYTNFLNPAPYTENKPRENNQVSQAMKEIFNYIENHENLEFTLKELKDVLTEYVPDDKTIIARLQQKYLSNIVITTKVGSFTLISFRTQLHKVYVEQAWTPEDIDSLISLVKTYNAIFDQSHPDYNTKENLDNIWQQIGIKLKRAPESCSKRWQLLFSIYKKKKITQKLNSDKIPKWPYFDSLDFLKDYLKDIPNAKFSATNTHSQSSGTSQDNSEQASLTEAVFLTENNYNNVLVSEEFGDIKTEIKLEDNFEEIQNDSENEFSNDMESNSRLENYYTNNSYSVDEQGNEMESCSELEGFGNHLTPDTSKSGKSNSMELFLLSLVEDANNLSKTGQREFKTKTLALLHTLE